MTLKLRTLPRFPSNVSGSGIVDVAQVNGAYTVSLKPGVLLPAFLTIADPVNTYALMWNGLTGVFTLVQPAAIVAANKVVKIITAAGPYAADPNDDVIIVKQAVAAPFTVTVNWSTRIKPLTIVDGKGDAAVNYITITPTAGQTQLAKLNFSYVIAGNGGTVTLSPLPDGTGAY